MEKLFELTFQDQTLNPQVGTFTDASQTTGTFTLEDGEYYLTNGDTKGFYTYAPIAIQPDSGTDNKITVEFDLKVATASVNTHTIIGTYAGVDSNGIPAGAKITLQYNAGDIELVLGSGATATLIESADVVVDQWYHFCIACALDAPTESTYEVKIDGVLITTVTGATTDYELGIISVLGTDLHACDECGIKNIRLITDDDYFVGRTALNQAFKDVKGYVDTNAVDLSSNQTVGGIKTFSNAPVVNSINLDGKTIDTDTNDNMTFNGHIVDTIEEQGVGYIRYSNGLQICWGSVSWQSDCSRTWGSLYETSNISGSYAKSFVNTPSVSVLGTIEANSGIVECSSTGTQTQLPTIYLCRATPVNIVATCVIKYVAIGHWK